MKKNNLKILIFSVVVCLLPIIAGLILYDKLPAQMAVHFDLNNEPDLYTSKIFALFGIPVIATFSQTVLSAFLYFQIGKTEKIPKLFTVTLWAIPLITIFLYAVTVSFALSYPVNIGKLACLSIGILMCAMGNYFPKMNYEDNKNFINPQPKDEKSFRKITKSVGYSCIAMGLIFFVLAFIN